MESWQFSIILGLLFSSVAFSEPSIKWTWMSGSTDGDHRSIYGIKGVPNPQNKPSTRRYAVGWFDSKDEELWIFGGQGYDSRYSGILNDLWRYKIKESMWTWMAGNNTVNHYATYGIPGVPSADITPGSRHNAVGWYDSEAREYWLFTGYGVISDISAGIIQELWKYRVNDSTWTLVSPKANPDHRGIFGEKGNASTEYMPGARYNALGLFDSTRKEFWLFGGYGYANATTTCYGWLNDLWRYRMNDSTWTWISGNSDCNQLASYGEKGIANSTNIIGARQGSVGWFDSTNQELWIFGGYGVIDRLAGEYLNDLWKYRVSDDTWTWIAGDNTSNPLAVYGEKGIADPSNAPGGRRDAVGWYDSLRQQFWLFGGDGYTNTTDSLARKLNDLWRYDVSDGTWTWISGSTTSEHPGVHGEKGQGSIDYMPPASKGASGWIVGGYQLWKYRVNDNTWTWIAGHEIRRRNGLYGEKGKASPNNVPGLRRNPLGWYDRVNKELWVFGGYGYDATSSTYDDLNDLWKYRMNDSTWTWISGSDTFGQPGIYGEKGVSNETNVPGARSGAVGWFDSTNEEFWVFGGYGRANDSKYGILNDLWKYRVKDSTWTWISGSSEVNKRGVYGEKGNASTDYIPGARSDAVGWYNSITKEFWLFGGFGYTDVFDPGYLNDLWRYRMSDDTWTWISGSSTPDQPGVYNDTINNIPSARLASFGWYDSNTREAWIFGGYEYSLNYLNELWRYRENDNTWTLISGGVGQPGVYGEKGRAHVENIPGSRQHAVGWYDDTAQELWLYGGYGYGYDTTIEIYLNDWWRFRINDSTWTWIYGSDVPNEPGAYGDKGVESVDNMPGSRYGPLLISDDTSDELWLFGGSSYLLLLNDLWKGQLLKERNESNVLNCPPLHKLVNGSCIPDIICSAENEDSNCELECETFAANATTDVSSCTLECDSLSTPGDEHGCIVEGDINFNGSIAEVATVTIVGVINVTGTVIVAGETTLKLSPGGVLHVAECLVLDEKAQIVVVLDGVRNATVVASYDGNCSTPQLAERVNIEPTSSVDKCRDGIPTVEEYVGQEGRAQLQVLLVPVSDDECSDSSGLDTTMLAIIIAVPIAVLAVVIVIVAVVVHKVRAKSLPGAI